MHSWPIFASMFFFLFFLKASHSSLCSLLRSSSDDLRSVLRRSNSSFVPAVVYNLGGSEKDNVSLNLHSWLLLCQATITAECTEMWQLHDHVPPCSICARFPLDDTNSCLLATSSRSSHRMAFAVHIMKFQPENDWFQLRKIKL